MNRLIQSAFLAGALLAAGCANDGWQAQNVPLPRATPFDSNEFARTAYLDGFSRGYNAEISGASGSPEMISGPYLQARRQGFHAGAAHARAEKAGVTTEAAE